MKIRPHRTPAQNFPVAFQLPVCLLCPILPSITHSSLLSFFVPGMPSRLHLRSFAQAALSFPPCSAQKSPPRMRPPCPPRCRFPAGLTSLTASKYSSNRSTHPTSPLQLEYKLHGSNDSVCIVLCEPPIQTVPGPEWASDSPFSPGEPGPQLQFLPQRARENTVPRSLSQVGTVSQGTAFRWGSSGSQRGGPHPTASCRAVPESHPPPPHSKTPSTENHQKPPLYRMQD